MMTLLLKGLNALGFTQFESTSLYHQKALCNLVGKFYTKNMNFLLFTEVKATPKMLQI